MNPKTLTSIQNSQGVKWVGSSLDHSHGLCFETGVATVSLYITKMELTQLWNGCIDFTPRCPEWSYKTFTSSHFPFAWSKKIDHHARVQNGYHLLACVWEPRKRGWTLLLYCRSEEALSFLSTPFPSRAAPPKCPAETLLLDRLTGLELSQLVGKRDRSPSPIN